MIARKSIDFFARALATQPVHVPSMLMRRSYEAFGRAPASIATTWFGDVRYDVDMRLHRLTQKYYFHTHEMYLERVFRSVLRPGAVFVDIGANLGYWSAFSLSLVGREGAVHAFEPVPLFHASLERLKANNPGYQVHANLMACGAEKGVLPMAVVAPTPENYNNFDTNIGTSSILPGFLDHDAALTQMIDVEVARFDDYASAHNLDLDRIGLIKIDVEGFESYCFDGMPNVLGKSGRKVPILCEVLTDTKRHELLNGAAIIRRLEGHGYRCLDATTFRPIETDRMRFEENILCVDASLPV